MLRTAPGGPANESLLSSRRAMSDSQTGAAVPFRAEGTGHRRATRSVASRWQVVEDCLDLFGWQDLAGVENSRIFLQARAISSNALTRPLTKLIFTDFYRFC